MEYYKILIMQYEKLISMQDLNHKRWIDHWKTFLTILTILMAILTALIKVDKKGFLENGAIIFISIAGIIISLSGWISLCRIRKDANLTYFHLRKIENIFFENNFNYVPIFNNGRDLFKKGILGDLTFKNRLLRKLNLTYLASISFIIFALFFLLILLIKFFFIDKC